MGFLINEGCCGLSLQESCLIIGIIYLALNIISCCSNVLLSFGFGLLLEPLLYIIVSICLIVGAVNADRDLLIPWMVAFAITCILFLFLLCGLIGSGIFAHIIVAQDHREAHKKHFKLAVIAFCFYLVKFVIEIILFQYVLSFYTQLQRGDVEEMALKFVR